MNVYALKHTNEIRKISSSGGAFLAIAEAFFKQAQENGEVYGIYFDRNMVPVYGCAKNLQECKSFCGSKYVKPILNTVFSDILISLKNDKQVLFVGIPCQVSALLKYLKRNKALMTKFYSIDLICNGTPENNIWLDYVKYVEAKYKNELIDFKFRLKGDPCNPYQTMAIFKNGSTIVDSNITASYNRLYLKKLLIQKSCFNCPFKSSERVGDFTIGDFWGIDRMNLEIFDKFGISMMIVSSNKGMRLFNKLNGKIFIQECNEKTCNINQINLTENTPLPKKYEVFWKDYKKRGLDYIIKKYADGGCFGIIKHRIRHIYRYLKLI